MVQVCLTAVPAGFPDCTKDPAGRHLTVPANTPMPLRIADVAPGRYAITLFHDENSNGHLDRRFGIPTEGFGFSNNPHSGLGLPSFADVLFTVGAVAAAETVRVRYLF